MDKNPKPMKDFKPVKKVENAADQFSKTHQAQFETMAKTSRDRVQIVENHNRACPKLQDELQKRRSLARVTITSASRGPPKIGACRKTTNRKQPGNKTNSRRKYKTLKNVNKRKFERGRHKKYLKKRKNLKSMIATCPRCLCELRKKQMPIRIKDSLQCIYTAKKFNKSQTEDAASLRTARQNRRPKKDTISVTSSNCPDTSNQSFVSYHSFASMNKEPMVE